MFNDFYQALELIENNLNKDLIGPSSEYERIVKDTPLNYYVSGVLWARRSTDMELNDIEELEDALAVDMDTISAGNRYKPSAMAISVMLPKKAQQLTAVLSFARYQYSEVQEKFSKLDADGIEREFTRAVPCYQRQPITVELIFDIPQEQARVNPLNVDCRQQHEFEAGLCVRKVFPDGAKLVTIAIVNAIQAAQQNIEQNTAAMFQCSLQLNSAPNCFLPLHAVEAGQDAESMVAAMQYRTSLSFAQGHGCSVEYEAENNAVQLIGSSFAPKVELEQMMASALEQDEFLYMHYWQSAERQAALNSLGVFIKQYKKWCEQQARYGAKLKEHSQAVDIAIKDIRICIERLYNGLETLQNNQTAYKAFQLMNEAMCLQRVKHKRCTPESVKWYPFQFAYILQILPDIVQPDSNYKNTVDLLWFPTGGGKTEAYLGVAAFTIFWRRLSKQPTQDGVNIIMRYTLRLLTIQQFDRATILICACESLRKKYLLAGGEISIGLWIGSDMTPNKLEEAAERISELRADPDKKLYEGNPQQIAVCPWCKAAIDIGCYSIGHNMLIKCPNKNCEFHQGLPVYLVDQDIYKQRPTLLLSTVDKFARIVWEEQAGNLFGGADILPPELIIQDELHLISGPLGSIAGIYEIAVQKLCEAGGKTPKIIASTATVRHAKSQIANLYNRASIQFPPAGIDIDDSFFAVRADKNTKPARTYIGLSESGGSMADLLIRVYANLSFSRRQLIRLGYAQQVVDNYFTFIGYFNSIKDLGASSGIINDRVGSYLRSLVTHKLAADATQSGLTMEDFPIYEQSDELTSRKNAKEIKETLTRLETSYPDEGCYAYVLASNMLSVGIDIERLGVMAVYNQPKSHAEFIQATSRVGRSRPGLILVLYNAARSRDKSHFEQFTHYHRTMYQYVEASSVTPFSTRALEKALHCAFTALVRHQLPGMNSNSAAAKFRNTNKGVAELKNTIIEIISSKQQHVAVYARAHLEDYCCAWEQLARNNPDTFVYTNYSGGVCLLQPAEKANDLALPTTLNALRNVDDSSDIYILRRDV